MKAMFAYEHKFCRDENGMYYSPGHFPYRLWQRYLEVFDELVVVGRVRKMQPWEKIESMDLSNGPKVSFVEVPSISNPWSMLFAHREAERKIQESLVNCDALIVRTSAIGLLASRIAEKLHKPWAVEVVGCAFDAMWHHGSWQGKVYAPFAAYEIRKMIHKAPYALYVTQKFLQNRYPCQGHSVGCSDVHLGKMDQEILERRLKKIDQPQAILKIGLIGSLVHSHKGIKTALKALGMIRDRLPDFEFNILGGGDQQKWRDAAKYYGVASQTVFCGILTSGAAVNSWLDEMDLYIQPSLVEGLPRALVEAMSRGCPALGSSVGGIPELLDTECLHQPGDAGALARKMENVINDRQWLARQAAINFHKATAFESQTLHYIRQGFWLDFITYCQNNSETTRDEIRQSSYALARKTIP